MNELRKKKIQTYFEGTMAMQRALCTSKDVFLKKFDLNRPQAEVLYILAHEQKLTIKEIASKMNMSSSAATQIIEGLVKSDFLERTESTEDRRVTYVNFSQTGKTKFEHFKKAHIERIGSFLKVLTNEELDTLIKIPQKVLATLQSQQ